MNREEAIGVIKSECYVFNPLNIDRSTRINTALDMAIQALEQEPCEDAISRKSMLDYIKYLHGEMPEEEFVKALPSVTPARKKGHWIDHSDEGFVECSECGSCTNCDGNIADLHFCFSCGAEMESEE